MTDLDFRTVAGYRMAFRRTGGHFVQLDEPGWVAERFSEFMRTTTE